MIGVVGVSVTAGLWGCVSENPFESDGEGTIQLRTVVNSITTRADEDETNNGASDPLRDNCVVYITSDKGLIYKEKGLDNVKTSFTLKAGSYVAEAWTGDSVSASFDKKFYRGYEPFEVTKGLSGNVVLNCKIANVVASINTSSIDPNLMNDDYEITIKNSVGELTFTKDNAVDAKGFFMMPFNKEGERESELSYTIAGTRKDGETFTKNGVIPDVEPAHNYILNFEYNAGSGHSPEVGAAFIKINIKDEELTENSNYLVQTRPTITGIDFDIERQIMCINDEDIPEQISVQICGFEGLEAISLSSESASELGWPNAEEGVNILKADKEVLDPILNSGVELIVGDKNSETNVVTASLTFSKSLIANLSKDLETEHSINIYVEDSSTPRKNTQASLRIVRNEDAIVLEDPIKFDQVDQDDDFNITSNAVTLTYTLAEGIEGTPGVEYAKDGEDDWTFVAASVPNAISRNGLKKAPVKYSVTITGLEEGTTYKYRAVCGDFHSNHIMKFETYSKFIIPNWDMEKWAAISAGGQKNVKMPSRTGSLDFWGNGNPGAKMAGEILTDESTDMFHSASKSARLESKFASLFGIGKFAAGNLFAGEYVKTDGTDGVLKFGQKFEDFAEGKKVDVRPSALRVYVNYRPKASVKEKGAVKDYIEEGELDQGQIYVALTTAQVDIRTKSTNQKLFDSEDPEVLAYGEYTFEGNYGDDGQLKVLIIPIEYFPRSEGVLPTHLVIVCSASKYGDYFSGGVGSTMYLDDFELIYE